LFKFFSFSLDFSSGTRCKQPYFKKEEEEDVSSRQVWYKLFKYWQIFFWGTNIGKVMWLH